VPSAASSSSARPREIVDQNEILREIENRDHRDKSRAVAR
jgi:cytidylate kinase